MGTLLMIILTVVVIVLPNNTVGFIVSLSALIINTFVPDLIPFVDEIVMFVSMLMKIKGVLNKNHIPVSRHNSEDEVQKSNFVKWE